MSEEKKTKEVEIKTKSPMWVVVLVGILVIALGCEFVYIRNLKNAQQSLNSNNNEVVQNGVVSESQSSATLYNFKTLNEMAIKKLTSGEVYNYDLNGDSTTEKIELWEISTDDDDDDEYTTADLYINDTKVEENISNEIYFIDIDKNDGLINLVTTTRTNGIGYKFSTYQNGKLVSYNDYNEMWVSNNAKDSGDLLKINSAGEILLYDNILDGFEEEIYTKLYKFENGKLVSDSSLSSVSNYINKKIQYTPNGETCIIENLDNIGEYYTTYSGEEESTDTNTINTKYKITDLGKGKIYLTIISTKEDNGNTYLKVRMENGTEGYLVLNAKTEYAISQ